MQCPSNNAVTNNSAVDTYKKLASNILKLVELDEVPLPLNEKIINEKADLGDFLIRNNAKYHKNCKRHFDNDRVKRDEGRGKKKKENKDPTRSSRCLSVVKTKTPLCFFCEKPEEKRKILQEVQRFDSMLRFVGMQSILAIRYSILRCRMEICVPKMLSTILSVFAHYTEMGRTPELGPEPMIMIGNCMDLHYRESFRLSTRLCDQWIQKLADITKYYSEYLQKYGIENYKVHSTRLKQRIMEHFDDMYEQQQGRDIILGFTSDLSDIISSAKNSDFDNEGVILAEAGKILRWDILEMNDTVFNGMFNQNCQEDSIHDSVKCILSTILHGNVTSSPHYKQAILTIGQLIRFNTLKRARKSSSSAYHSK